MIGRLSGTLLEMNPPQIVLDVQGVGYEVDVPMSTFYNLPALHEKVVLHTQLIVREDAHLLFGFLTHEERVVPPVAQDQRRRSQARTVGAVRPFHRRPRRSSGEQGRIASHQNTRRGQEDRRAPVAGTAGQFTGQMPAWCGGRIGRQRYRQALLALGYNEKEADWAAKQLPKEAGVSDGIRQALKLLSKA
jgi:Holliday junction DNA helicase RuvA